MVERLEIQRKCFGVETLDDMRAFGIEARTRIFEWTAGGFTVLIPAEKNLSAPLKGRVYGFIRLKDGGKFSDLSERLVALGWARAYGLFANSPEDREADFKDRLDIREKSAILDGLGIWASMNPEARKKFQSEQEKLKARLRKMQCDYPFPTFDVNRASQRELKCIPYIKEGRAASILKARALRPFTDMDDFASRVPGIGRKGTMTYREISKYTVFSGGKDDENIE